MENLHVEDVNWNAIAVILGVTAVLTILFWQPVQNYFRGLKMKQERRENLQHTYLERLVEDVEDDVAAGVLTRTEAREEIYDPLRRAFNRHKALYPSEEWLKNRVQKRIQNGIYESVPLPDLQPKKGRDLRKTKTA